MTDTDKRAFMDAMRRTGVAFGAVVDDPQLAVYWDGLRDLELDVLREAFHDCTLALKFFPRIVDLRDAAGGVQAKREAAKTARLLAAWQPEPRAAITEAQWQERWAAIKAIANQVPMKRHQPLRGRCDCADCRRHRLEAGHAAR